MNVNILSTLIRDIAPTVSGALFGADAKKVVANIGDFLFGDKNLTDYEITERLEKDRSLILKLKELEFNYAMAKITDERDKLEILLRDVQHSRDMNSDDETKYAHKLATLIFIGFFVLIAFITWGNPPEAMREPMLIIVGGYIGLITMIGNFFFGTSVSSKKKDGIIGMGLLNKLTKGANDER